MMALTKAYTVARRGKVAFKQLSSLATPAQVQIVEVGPRDGLQNESNLVTVEHKVELIQRLVKAGVSYIEAGSFVSAKWVPNMANSLEVMQGVGPLLDENPTLRLACLVPNVAGLEKAIQVKASEVAIFGSTSEAFSQKNINCSIVESMERFSNVMQRAKEANMPVRGYVSCVLGCPYQGQVPISDVARITEQMLDMGCYQVSLGDTIGIGTPGATVRLLEELKHVVGSSLSHQLAVHFHDTYGQALANILVALERDITTVDSAVAGLGGCPYAKGASGNVASEDVVYMLDRLGVETGVDLDKLAFTGEYICQVLGRESRSRAGQAILAKLKSQ